MMSDPYLLGLLFLHAFYEDKTGKSHRKVAPYFAYGSQMNQKLLEKQVGTVQYLSRGIIENYELTFSKKLTSRESSGTASLQFSSGSCVEGAIFLLTKQQFQQIARVKGRLSYRLLKQRISLQDSLRCKEGHPSEIIAGVFVLDAPNIAHLRPNKLYLSNIQTAAKEIGLSKKYLEALKAHEEPDVLLKSKL